MKRVSGRRESAGLGLPPLRCLLRAWQPARSRVPAPPPRRRRRRALSGVCGVAESAAAARIPVSCTSQGADNRSSSGNDGSSGRRWCGSGGTPCWGSCCRPLARRRYTNTASQHCCARASRKRDDRHRLPRRCRRRQLRSRRWGGRRAGRRMPSMAVAICHCITRRESLGDVVTHLVPRPSGIISRLLPACLCPPAAFSSHHRDDLYLSRHQARCSFLWDPAETHGSCRA